MAAISAAIFVSYALANAEKKVIIKIQFIIERAAVK